MNSTDARAVFGNVLGKSTTYLAKALAELDGTTGPEREVALQLLCERMVLLVKRIWVNGDVAIAMGADASQIQKGQSLAVKAIAYLPRPKSMSLLLDAILLMWSGMGCGLTPCPHPFFKAIEDDFREALTQHFPETLVEECEVQDQTV